MTAGVRQLRPARGCPLRQTGPNKLDHNGIGTAQMARPLHHGLPNWEDPKNARIVRLMFTGGRRAAGEGRQSCPNQASSFLLSGRNRVGRSRTATEEDEVGDSEWDTLVEVAAANQSQVEGQGEEGTAIG